MKELIKLCDDKYEIIFDMETGEFRALRYGEEWRNLCGDGMILSMFFRIQELEEEVKKLKSV